VSDIIEATTSKPVADAFQFSKYLVRRKVLKLVGGAFHVFGPNGEVVLYSQMKAFKLREDIRIYTGEDMQAEVLTINARQILDISATYDVKDSTTGEKIGVLQRKGLKSILKDEWVIMDANENQMGTIKEDNMALALIRRFLTNLIPQKYTGEVNGRAACTLKQNFNPFVMKIEVDFSQDAGGLLDRRLGLAAAILLCAVEGKQN